MISIAEGVLRFLLALLLAFGVIAAIALRYCP
jgi:hypothetical protein